MVFQPFKLTNLLSVVYHLLFCIKITAKNHCILRTINAVVHSMVVSQMLFLWDHSFSGPKFTRHDVFTHFIYILGVFFICSLSV
jgi:hypothetical protein